MNDMTAAAQALNDAEAKTEQAEQALKDAKEHERKLREEVIPAMFSELGLKTYGLDDGSTFSVTQEVYASIPKPRREEAYTWLDNNGWGALIKTEVACEFGKGQMEAAKKLYIALQDMGLSSTTLDRTVHPMTLKAWIREQLAQGEPVDLELFGARAVDTAKVKKP
jgi:hypothetical protein